MKKNKMVGLSFMLILAFSTISFAGTLAECNWDTGTGSGTTAVQGGFFGYGPGNTAGFEVYKDDGTVPGGRNFLRIKGEDSDGPMYQTSGSFGDPSTLYMRVWARPWTTGTAHTSALTHTSGVHNASLTMVLRLQAGAHSISCSGLDYYRRRNITYSTGTWYRLEFKITQNTGANDSIEVRVDGVDVTTQYLRASGAISLAFDKDSLDLHANNYFTLNTSSTYPDRVVDYAGLKFADDGWIGDDSGGSEPNESPDYPKDLRIINNQ